MAQITSDEQRSGRAVTAMIFIMALLTTSACTPFSASLTPEDTIELPQQYALYDEAQSQTGSDRWWEDFNSEDLNHLVDEALRDNLSLKQSWAKLDQVGALARQAGSSRYPDLSLTSSATSSHEHEDDTTSTSESYSLQLSSSYEFDLWGRVAAANNAQQQELQATREDLNAAAMTVAGEISDRWLQLQGQIEQQRLLVQQLMTASDYLQLIDLRYRKAQSSALDLVQQQESIAALQTQLPDFESTEQQLRHELAILLGKAPQSDLQLIHNELPELPPLPETGLPAELLARRPDIRAAGMRVKVADWQLTEARADRLPAITLSADLYSTVTGFSTLLEEWALDLAASVTAPLFDGGYRKAEVDYYNAVIDEKLAAYKETVLEAIREVEDALISEAKLQEELKALSNQYKLAEKALKVARKRYQAGQSTYLTVLTEQQSVESLQQSLVSQKLALLTNRVELYRALGGSWTQQLETPKQEVTL